MVSFVPLDGDALRRYRVQLAVIDGDCFTAPPWNEPPAEIAAYPARLQRQTSYPGARGVLAMSGAEMLGAAYGWLAPATLPDATEHDRAVRDAVPSDVAALLVAPAMAVAELMVTPAWQRRGIGGRLLAELVGDAPRAWLATHPQAGAVHLYERAGWRRQVDYQAGGHPLVLFTKEFSSAAGR